MSEWRRDQHTTSIFRVRRSDPETKRITGTRYYAKKPAALQRAERWREAGYLVDVDRAGPVRFQGYR